ncbi:hypothetical protein M565_ctg1P0542 [Vibrio cyclitrophicus FF75]|nr:hypothetical protein M565_ctg1P0542 [Vibrio cyclitrophicus FF75]
MNKVERKPDIESMSFVHLSKFNTVNNNHLNTVKQLIINLIND